MFVQDEKIKLIFFSPSSGHLMFCLFSLLKWMKYNDVNIFACEDKTVIFTATAQQTYYFYLQM